MIGDAAELVVVDGGGDGGVIAADWAIGVSAELEGAEFHGEGIDVEEFAEEGLADVGDEFDGFGGLEGADDAW